MRTLPYALVTAFALVVGMAWGISMANRQTVACFNINGYGEGWIETAVFLIIGFVGLYYLFKDPA